MTSEDLLDAYDAAWLAALSGCGTPEPPIPDEYLLPAGHEESHRHQERLLEIANEYQQRMSSQTDTAGSPASAGRAGPFPELPGFTVESEIGRGAKGVVYRAVQHSLNRVVAIKTFPPDVIVSSQDLNRLRNEARILGQLRHPNIVDVHSLEELPQGVFLVMEYVSGSNLADRVRSKPLDSREAAAYILAAARAVQSAHEARVLHRDLKPSNILLDQEGLIRVTDFGLSRQESLLQGNPSLTATVEVLGTPGYISPEQAGGRTRELRETTDVYGLGATLYHLLTGRPPFAGDTILDVLQQVRMTDPPALKLLRPGVPVPLQTICHKCLAKLPSDRYASAGSLADDLQRFLNGEEIHARPTGLLRRGIRWYRRNPLLATLGCAAVCLLVMTLLLMSDRNARIRKDLAEAGRRNLDLQEALDREQNANELAYDSLVRRAVLEYETNQLDNLEQIISQTESAARSGQRSPWEWRWLKGLLHRGLHSMRLGEPPAEWIGAIAVRSDGRQFVAGTRNPLFKDRGRGTPGRLVVYDLQSGHVVRDLGPVLSILDLTFSSDERILYAVESDAGFDQDSSHYFGPGRVRRWDTASWEELPSVADGAVIEHVLLTGNPRQLLTVEANNSPNRIVQVWDAAEPGTPLAEYQHWQSAESFLGVTCRDELDAFHDIQVTSPCQLLRGDWSQAGLEMHSRNLMLRSVFRHDGHGRATLEVRRKSDLKLLQSLPLDSIERLAISPQEQLLAIATQRGEIQIWSTSDWVPVIRLRGHRTRISAIAFSGDGSRLVSGDWSGTLIVWDLNRSESFIDTLTPVRGNAVETFTATSDDRLVAQVAGMPLQEIATGERRPLRRVDLEAPERPIAPGRQVDLSEDGRWMATVEPSQPEVAGVRSTETGKWLVRLPPHGSRVSYVRVIGELIATAAWPGSAADGAHRLRSGELRLSEIDGTIRFSALLERSRIFRVALSPNRQYVSASVATFAADGSQENSVQTWELNSGRLVDRLAMPGWVLGLEYSPDQELWAVDFESGELTIREPGAGRTRLTRAGFGPQIQDLMFSPAEPRLAGVSRSQLTLWNTKTIRSVLALPLRTFESDFVFSPRVRFSRDGRRLFANQADGTIRMWEAEH